MGSFSRNFISFKNDGDSVFAKLPWYLQPISKLVPTTYIFEAMRSLVQTGMVDPLYIVASFGLNIIYLLLCIWIFLKSFQYSRNLGLGRFNN